MQNTSPSIRGSCSGRASRNSEFSKYLLFQRFARRLLGDWRILQACFPKKAWLKHCISLKSNPPCALDRQSLSQDCQCIFLFFSLEFHQKDDIALVRLSQEVLGNLKQDIAYTGMAIATDLRRISLPPCDSIRANHPDIRVFSLS